MKLNELFKVSAIMLAQKAKENPNGGLKKGNIKITYAQVSEELNKLSSWCTKENLEITQVIRCKDCTNFTTQKEGKFRVTRCSLDKERKSENHYCAYGRKE